MLFVCHSAICIIIFTQCRKLLLDNINIFYYIGCGWRFVGEKNSCTVYYVLNNEMWCNFTEQMYKDIQLELELKLKEALVENRKKELEKDFVNGT